MRGLRIRLLDEERWYVMPAATALERPGEFAGEEDDDREPALVFVHPGAGRVAVTRVLPRHVRGVVRGK